MLVGRSEVKGDMQDGPLRLNGGSLRLVEALKLDVRFGCRFTYSLEFHTHMKKSIQNSNSRDGPNPNRVMAPWILELGRMEGCLRERNCQDGIGNGLLEIS